MQLPTWKIAPCLIQSSPAAHGGQPHGAPPLPAVTRVRAGKQEARKEGNQLQRNSCLAAAPNHWSTERTSTHNACHVRHRIACLPAGLHHCLLACSLAGLPADLFHMSWTVETGATPAVLFVAKSLMGFSPSQLPSVAHEPASATAWWILLPLNAQCKIT